MNVNIYEYGSKIKEEISEFLKTAGVESFELTNEIKRTKEKDADFRAWAGDKEGWYEFISDAKDVEAIDRYKDTYFKVINGISERKRKEKAGEKKSNASNWWSENNSYWKESNDWWKKYLNGELDWQKDQKKRDEENKKKLEESKRNKDESDKKRFITDIEMELTKENITNERLSKRLEVSDWRDKIRQADGFYGALSMRSHLWDIIRKLKQEFTCASCGEKKEEYYNYPTEDGKFCSLECWNKGKKDDDKKDDSNKSGRKFESFSINDFFELMRKFDVVELKFDFDKNQVSIKTNSGKSLEIKDLGLSTERQEKLTNELKSANKPIKFNEISEEVSKKGKGGNRNGDGDSKAGIIAAVVIVVLVVAVIVGVIIGKSKGERKDY